MNPVVGLFPALPLKRNLDLGEWLIGTPSPDLIWRSNQLRERFSELLQSFERHGFKNGSVLWHRDRGIDGQPPTIEAARAIWLATRFAALDANDQLGGEIEGVSGHLVVTADNATLILQPIDDENGTATHVRGYLKRITTVAWKTGEAPIPLPEDTVAMLGPVNVSSRLTRAVYNKLISAETLETRRLRLAIEWHGMAMANTPSVTSQQRIIAIKTGFEALFGESNSRQCAKRLRECFDTVTRPHRAMLPWRGLLWRPNERRGLRRSYRNKEGVEKQDTRSEIEDWFMALAEARNNVIHHGCTSVCQYPPPPERPLSQYSRWRDGYLFWVGERVLREAIKAHLGAEHLLAEPYAKQQFIEERFGENREPRGEEPQVATTEEVVPEEKPVAAGRSAAELVTILGCPAANYIEIGKGDGLGEWVAEAGGQSLLVFDAERERLIAAGAEEVASDVWWDAG